MILLTLFDFLTKPKLLTLRVSSWPNGKPGTYDTFCDNSALWIMAESETDEGESGIVANEDRRGRKLEERESRWCRRMGEGACDMGVGAK